MRLLKVGRSVSCDIVLRSDKVSSIHAEITVLNNGDIILEDKGSHNGTYVMNQRIASDTPVNIRRGDAVRFADVELMWDQVPMPERSDNYKAMYSIGSNFRNEIQITGHTVSRFHATLKIDKSGRAYIQDHSKNGTMVNGNRISSGQNVAIKRSDSVTCGGVPVDIKRYIPGSMMPKLLVIAACLAAVVAVGFAAYTFLMSDKETLKPVDHDKHYRKTVVLTYFEYRYDLYIKDNPFVGYASTSDLPVCSIPGATGSGTAFFVNKDGMLVTNKHVANPWLYADADERTNLGLIREAKMSELLPNRSVEYLENKFYDGNVDYKYEPILESIYYDSGRNTALIAMLVSQFHKCDCEWVGRISDLSIAIPGVGYRGPSDFEPCTVCTVSDKYDIALIQLHSRVTPEGVNVVNLNDYVAIEDLSVKDDYYYMGYPAGAILNYSIDNEEFSCKYGSFKLSRSPKPDKIEFNRKDLGGVSGSPIFDTYGRLVGIIHAGNDYAETLVAAPAKHIYNMYKEYMEDK